MARLHEMVADELEVRDDPTVRQYAERWMKLHSASVRPQTMVGYRSRINTYILPYIGDMRVRAVTQDDCKECLLAASDKSRSVCDTVDMLLKMIFGSAKDSHIIKELPCPKYQKIGKPEKKKEVLTNEQVQTLIRATEGTVVETFIKLAVYTGMRREEILALQWDKVHLTGTPYIEVTRSLVWHGNQPEVSDELKTDAAERNIPIADALLKYLRGLEPKDGFLVHDRSGDCLTQTQWRSMWKAVTNRSTLPHKYVKYVDGEKVETWITPKKGDQAYHRDWKYEIDFYVHPHMIRRTWVTRMITSGVDPKTVQYLAGHKNSRITMDIYAQVMYNKPQDTAALLNSAFTGA